MGFNGTSILVSHFVSSPEKGRKKIEEIVKEMKEGQGRKRNRTESEVTEEIKHSPLPSPAARIAGDLLYVFPCVILFLCFSVLLVL